MIFKEEFPGVKIIIAFVVLSIPVCGFGAEALGSPWELMALKVNDPNSSTSYSLNLQLLLFFTALTFLPSMLLMMTSFTRIIIVLSMLRHALGLPQTPSNQIIIGISLFMTAFIMSDTCTELWDRSLKPFSEEKISFEVACQQAKKPVSDFLQSNIRKSDLHFFEDLSKTTLLDEEGSPKLHILIPAFITSELKTAFQMGFLVFIPFLIIDFVVSSILMTMGMMMLSPMIISLPFKIMLFVAMDGWQLLLGGLAKSFLMKVIV